MAERRAVSLLDCAIAASVGRRAGHCSASSRWSRSCARPIPDRVWRQGRSDRYVSVRHVAALKTFERAVVRRAATGSRAADGARRARRPCRRAGANGAARPARRSGCARSPSAAPTTAPPAAQHRRAAERARRRAAALQRARRTRASSTASASMRRAGSPPPTTPWRRRSRSADAPGQRFQVRCADLAGALGALRRADAAMLETLGLARHRRRGDARALAPRPGDADHGARGDAHATRGAASPAASTSAAATAPIRPATSSPPRAARSSASARMPAMRVPRRDGGRARAAAPLPARPRRRALRRRARPAPTRSTIRAGWCRRRCCTLLQPLESLRQPIGRALPRLRRRRRASRCAPRPARAGSRNRVVLDGARGRRRLLGRPHDRPGAAGARAEDRRLLHRPPRRLPRARHAPRRGRRPAARRAAARRRDGADGGGRGHRRRQRPHRGARRRALAVRAPGGRRPRPRRRLRHAPAVSACSTAPTRSSTRPSSTTRCRPRRSSRSWRRRSSPTPSARGAACSPPSARRCSSDAHAGARQPARPADAIRLGALPRPHVLQRAGLRRAARRPWEVQAAARAFGWNAGCADARRELRQAPTCCSAAPLDHADERGSRAPGATAIAYGRAAQRAGRQEARRADAPDAADGARRRHRCAAAPPAPTAAA